jgi:hypothetical protein
VVRDSATDGEPTGGSPSLDAGRARSRAAFDGASIITIWQREHSTFRDYQNVASITDAILEKGRIAMITINKHLAAPVSALALGLALATLASPSFAQRSEYPISTARGSALRECNDLAQKYHNNRWGTVQLQTYRSCMAQHNEPE